MNHEPEVTKPTRARLRARFTAVVRSRCCLAVRPVRRRGRILPRSVRKRIVSAMRTPPSSLIAPRSTNASGKVGNCSTAAQLARNDLADVKRLLAPLEVKSDQTDQPPETEAVKAERQRLTDQASISESRVKQCEVIIVRADQLLERMTKLRSQVVLNTLLHRGISPLALQTWIRLRTELPSAFGTLGSALAQWGRDGLSGLRAGEQDLTPLSLWAILTLLLWWAGRTLRRRFGRGEAATPGQRDRTIVAAIDGLGLVLVPILAVWLIGQLLAEIGRAHV